MRSRWSQHMSGCGRCAMLKRATVERGRRHLADHASLRRRALFTAGSLILPIPVLGPRYTASVRFPGLGDAGGRL